MRFSDKKPNAAPEEQIFFQCSKCLLNFVRRDLRRFDFMFGMSGSATLCGGCCQKLVLAYGVESHELWALAVVIGMERSLRLRAFNDVRYRPMSRELRDRLVRSLDFSLAQTPNKVARMRKGTKDYIALVKTLEHGELKDAFAFATWQAEYGKQWRKDHSISDDLQDFFGFGDAVQANEEMGVLV